MEHSEDLLFGIASIFVLGIGAQWFAWRLRVPSILLLMLFGCLAGPVSGWIDPDELLGDLLLPVVSLSVAIILFEGSLRLRATDLREIGGPLWRLLTVGVLVTWLLSALGAGVFLRLDMAAALPLGALLVVTGPTVVGPLLQHIRPVGPVGPIARWEGIVIDPVGAVLAVLVFEAAATVRSGLYQQAMLGAVAGMLRTSLIGLLIGGLAAVLLVFLLRRHWIPDRLQSPVALMAVVTAFAASNRLQPESGLVTVTVMGVWLANQPSVTIKHILEFKENLSVLLISTLFILLTARLRFEWLELLGLGGVAFLAAIILVVRPAAVFASTARSSLKWRERAFLAWMAPRGIVAASIASVFALENPEFGQNMVAATFVVIGGTVAVYGLTAGPLAVRLGVASPNPQGVLIASAHPAARAIGHALQSAGFEVLLVDSRFSNTRAARMEGLAVHHANLLSESTIDDLNLGGIGRFIALTPNDEVNSLAALHFVDLFGRANVYQLAPEREGSGRTDTSSEHLHGRLLFKSDLTYRNLDAMFAAGGVVKTTKLTDEFDYSAFRQFYGENALILFVIREGRQLAVCAADQEFSPRPGQTLLALVIPDEEQPAASTAS